MQVADVYKLMNNWAHDPIWDLELDALDDKYTPYRQIMLDFAKAKRAEWDARYEAKLKAQKDKYCPIFTAGCPDNTFHCMPTECALWNSKKECCSFALIGIKED